MKIWPFLATLLISHVCLGLDGEDLELLRRNNMSDLEILLHVDEWGVKPKNDLEVLKYKGQERSTVDWENIDENTWLDFNKWKEQLKVKESTPDWKLKLKESRLLH